jgi:hypothetical protein
MHPDCQRLPSPAIGWRCDAPGERGDRWGRKESLAGAPTLLGIRASKPESKRLETRRVGGFELPACGGIVLL